MQLAVDEGEQRLALVGHLSGEVQVEHGGEVVTEGLAVARVDAVGEDQELLGFPAQRHRDLLVEPVEQDVAQEDDRDSGRQREQQDDGQDDAHAHAAEQALPVAQLGRLCDSPHHP